jgi:transposase
VDLGDKWSNYCIVGLDGETMSEGELQTSQQDFAEFFGALAPARVVMEVGTHPAWARDVVARYGHEVLVANPRQMEGPKKRKRKNDRIDAHKLARVGVSELIQTLTGMTWSETGEVHVAESVITREESACI